MKRTLRRLMLILMLAAGPVLLVGCPETPVGTVTDETGALVWDHNFDGVPDVNDAGDPEYVVDPKIYAAANQADTIGPLVLTGLASFGVPFVAAIAVFWKKYKFGKMTANLVASIQSGRASLKANGAKGSLDILDNALKAAQDPDAAAMVADLKKAAGLPSVSSP